MSTDETGFRELASSGPTDPSDLGAILAVQPPRRTWQGWGAMIRGAHEVVEVFAPGTFDDVRTFPTFAERPPTAEEWALARAAEVLPETFAGCPEQAVAAVKALAALWGGDDSTEARLAACRASVDESMTELQRGDVLRMVPYNAAADVDAAERVLPHDERGRKHRANLVGQVTSTRRMQRVPIMGDLDGQYVTSDAHGLTTRANLLLRATGDPVDHALTLPAMFGTHDRHFPESSPRWTIFHNVPGLTVGSAYKHNGELAKTLPNNGHTDRPQYHARLVMGDMGQRVIGPRSYVERDGSSMLRDRRVRVGGRDTRLVRHLLEPTNYQSKSVQVQLVGPITATLYPCTFRGKRITGHGHWQTVLSAHAARASQRIATAEAMADEQPVSADLIADASNRLNTRALNPGEAFALMGADGSTLSVARRSESTYRVRVSKPGHVRVERQATGDVAYVLAAIRAALDVEPQVKPRKRAARASASTGHALRSAPTDADRVRVRELLGWQSDVASAIIHSRRRS